MLKSYVWWSQRAALMVALVICIPQNSALAQDGSRTTPAPTGVLDSAWTRNRIDLRRYAQRLGLAPDAQRYARDLALPSLRPFTDSAPTVMAPLPQPAAVDDRRTMVSCPMPVVRLDSSAVPTMPRMIVASGDSGGIRVPSCVNPLGLL